MRRLLLTTALGGSLCVTTLGPAEALGARGISFGTVDQPARVITIQAYYPYPYAYPYPYVAPRYLPPPVAAAPYGYPPAAYAPYAYPSPPPAPPGNAPGPNCGPGKFFNTLTGACDIR